MKIITYLKIIFLPLLACLFLLILKYWIIIRTYGENDANPINFENFDNVRGLDRKIVPNIVHYVIFDQTQISFIGYLSILSVIKFHKPKNIFIHTNINNFVGYYWTKIIHSRSNNNRTKIELKYLVKPTHVYGKLLSSVYHSTDVARIAVLREWGGIYLDTDVVVLKSLDRYRYFEMTIGWPDNEFIGNQILICNKNARFLKYWLQSYQYYFPTKWYYNAGQLPTENILEKNPGLIHREKYYFGVDNLIDKLYSREPWPDWRRYYAIHLLSRHDGAPEFLNETIALDLTTPFGEIVRTIFYS